MTRDEISTLVEIATTTRPVLVEYKRETSSLRVRFDSSYTVRDTATSPAGEQPANEDLARSVKSPGMGFFSAAYPDTIVSGAYAEKDVDADEIVGFLRAGHILTPVVAAHAGRIQQIASDSSLVGYGDVLYRYIS